MTMDKYQIGLERMRELLGERADDVVAKLTEIAPDFSKYVVEFAYGDIGARKTLDDKTREVIIVSSLITQGVSGSPLRSHLIAMRNVGWSKAEIIEVFILLIVYVGFPKVVTCIALLSEILK